MLAILDWLKGLFLGLVILGFGVVYLVMGNVPGRLIGVGLIVLGAWLTVSPVRGAARHASEWLEDDWDGPERPRMP